MNIFGLIVGYSFFKKSKGRKTIVKTSKKGLFALSEVVVELSQVLAILICSIIKGIWFILNQIYRIIKNPNRPIMVVAEQKNKKKYHKKAKVIKLSDYKKKKTS